jgi:hypothetical protein
MRTIYPTLIVVALGVATLMWGLSGFGAIYGATDPVSDLESGNELEAQANNSAVSGDGSFNGSAQGADSDNIVGLIVSGTQAITGFAGAVALLPWEIQRLGFPYWFAFPMGLSAQAIVGIGVVQFAANRVYR